MMPPLKHQSESAPKPFIVPEYAFAVIGLVFGLFFVYANPPWQANDEDRHFYNSYFYATGQNGMRQDGDRIGGDLPAALYDVTSTYQGIRFSPTTKVNKARITQSAIVPLNESRTMFYNNPTWGINPVGYLPYVFGIRIGKSFDSNPVHLLWAARISGLLTYLAILCLAIRIIPVHKWVLFAVALTPMVLYQATSVTYDMLCIALSFLILALVVRFALRDKPISTPELALFFLVLIVQRYAKGGYVLLPFLFFLVPQKNIGAIKRTASILLFICALFFLPRYTWDAYVSSLQLRGGVRLQNDFLFDTGKQIAYFVQQPGRFAWYFLLNVASQSKEWIVGAVGRFGYAYAGLTGSVVFLHGLALLTLSVLDTSPTQSLSLRQRLLAVGVSLGSCGLIIAGFFLRQSPVGAHVIFGLQGRYFLPILPFLLLSNYNVFFRSGLPENWKSLGVPVYCVGLLSYALHFINDYYYGG